MKFILDDYIEKYLQNEDNADDRKIARHLKKIIPQTRHIDTKTFKEIIEVLKKKMNNGCNFKTAFREVCEEYVLVGSRIKADLPGIFTRIIINDSKFINHVVNNRSIPVSRKKIKIMVRRGDRGNIERLFAGMNLSIKKVVFAAFGENVTDVDPFKKCSLDDIVNMLALDISWYKEKKPLRAVKIRYTNEKAVIKRFPVFTDAGWNDRFHPAKKDDNYGKTKPTDDTFKGMPEIVHENLKLGKVIVDIDFLKMKERK